MDQSKIRNVAIIAHVDHGKTTLVDELFKQSGLFHEHQEVEERLMDSMDLEKERGITITSKNGSCNYKNHLINIIDTPGHADFGGEVERVLHMADGAVFLVDAAEGPMPQSWFVLKKALAAHLPIIVVVNKIDKPAARCEWVIDQVFDLLVQLDAPDDVIDFPVVYASAKNGFAKLTLEEDSKTITPILDKIIEHVPPPVGDVDGPVQLQVSSISYSSFLGRLAVGKITSGSIKINQEIVVAQGDNIKSNSRITKIYKFKADQKVEADSAICGEIVAIAGTEGIRVGETITDKANPIPLPMREIDPPTVAMNFLPNDSPFAGQEGEFVTSRHIRDRLDRELLSDVALHVVELTDRPGFKVSGRGELHIAILIEKMRREGYEFAVSRPTVIYHIEDGQKMEPYEELTIEVAEEYMGAVMEGVGFRKGQMTDMKQESGQAILKFRIPTRGLLGYQAEFMMDTKGMGVMNYVFSSYDKYAGEIIVRKNGVILSKDWCVSIAYALFNIQERGVLFIGPGEKLYEGQVIGKYSKEDDLVVNPAKGKKLTNVRSSSSDDAVTLTPHTVMSLEQCLSFISDEELVEVTPKSIRMRKILLKEVDRKRKK